VGSRVIPPKPAGKIFAKSLDDAVWQGFAIQLEKNLLCFQWPTIWLSKFFQIYFWPNRVIPTGYPQKNLEFVSLRNSGQLRLFSQHSVNDVMKRKS
jgi:hypothetical protein